MAEAECRCTSAISPGMMSWMPANSELVMRDLPVSPGFSSTSTRRSASSAVITSPASSISFLTSENFHNAGRHLRLRLRRHQVLEHLPERRHVELGDLVVIGLPGRLHIVLGAGAACGCHGHERFPSRAKHLFGGFIAQSGRGRNRPKTPAMRRAPANIRYLLPPNMKRCG